MNRILRKNCLLDTNILIFVTDQNSPYHSEALKIFDVIARGELKAYVSTQNLLEYGAVLTRVYKVPQKEIAADIQELLSDSYFTVIHPAEIAVSIFLDFMNKKTGTYIYDLYLIATAIVSNMDYIITDDRELAKVKGIKIFNPFLPKNQQGG